MRSFLSKLRGSQDKKEGPIFLVGNDSMIKDMRKREGFDSWHNNW
jgi:hypothetical protein